MAYLVALGFALVLTPVARRAGLATGLVDRPGDPLKIHRRPVPVLGGVAVVVAAFAAQAVTGHAPAAALVAAAALVLAGGALDDLRPLPTRAHLALQATAATIVAAWAFDATALGAAGLFVLVLVCTNGVNVVDGQDGLAGGVAAIAAGSLALLLADTGAGQWSLGLALAGALCAFLVWNRSPARIFLGNGGAYAVGTLLAGLCAMVVADQGAAGIAPALMCVGVFLFDLAFTVVRRLGSGTLATGDRLHSYDLLSVALGTRGRATLAFWGLGALAGVVAVAVDRMPVTSGAVVTVAVAGAAAAAGVRLWSRTRGPRRLVGLDAPEAPPVVSSSGARTASRSIGR